MHPPHPGHLGHPVNAVVASISESLKSVADVNPTFMTTDQKAHALRALVEVESQIIELRFRVMATAGDVAAGRGDKNIAGWLARECRTRRADAANDLKLATALDRDYPRLAAAVRDAQVSVDQAHVIMRALDEINRDHFTQEVIDQAEQTLVDYAAQFGPTDLKRIGDKILTVVDPATAEAEEERRLRESEKHASEKQRLTMRAVGDGTTRISGLIPDHVAVRFATYLNAFTNPRLANTSTRPGIGSEDDVEKDTYGGPLARLARPKKLAQAFSQFLETTDPNRLPVHGGNATTMVVTIDFDALKAGVGETLIHNGLPGDGNTTITATQARRLACNARIIPAVLGGKSEILDLGRAQRLFTRAQNTALLLRDKTCRAEGCDIPGTWAEAHHLLPWSQGGTTDLANAALLCHHHHHQIHDPAHTVEHLSNGDIRFHRRR